MFEDQTRLALVYATCLQAAVAVYSGQGRETYEHKDLAEAQARRWFDQAMLVGETVVDADAEKHEKHREGE